MQKKARNTLLLVGGTGLIVVGGYGINRLYKSGKNLSIRMAGTHDFRFQGAGITAQYLSFRQDIVFVNPSSKKFKVDFEQIKILFDGEEIAYTDPNTENSYFTIDPRSTKKIEDLKIIIPGRHIISTVLPNAGSILQTALTEGLKKAINDKLPVVADKIELVILGTVNGVRIPEVPIKILEAEETELSDKNAKKNE